MATAYQIAYGMPASHIFGMAVAGGGIGLGTGDMPNLNDGIAMSSVCTMADTITSIGYRQGTTTGTPAGNSYTISLQTLTTGGLPSGAAVGGTTLTTFTPLAANDGKWVWVSLGGNTYSVTQGQEFAIVLQRTAATDASNKITAITGLSGAAQLGFPVALTAAAGVWSKVTNTPPMMGMKSAGAVYGRPFQTLFTGNSFGGTTEVGMPFTVPSTFSSTVALRGLRAMVQTPASSATNTFVATIYSSPTSSPARVDQSIAMATDRFNGFSANFRLLEFNFTSSTALTAGTTYAVALATTGAGDAGLYTLDMTAAGDFDGWDFREQAAYSTRTASSYAAILTGTATGNFAAATTTKRPWMELVFEDISFTGGAGGLLTHPGMAGGARG